MSPIYRRNLPGSTPPPVRDSLRRNSGALGFHSDERGKFVTVCSPLQPQSLTFSLACWRPPLCAPCSLFCPLCCCSLLLGSLPRFSSFSSSLPPRCLCVLRHRGIWNSLLRKQTLLGDYLLLFFLFFFFSCFKFYDVRF